MRVSLTSCMHAMGGGTENSSALDECSSPQRMKDDIRRSTHAHHATAIAAAEPMRRQTAAQPEFQSFVIFDGGGGCAMPNGGPGGREYMAGIRGPYVIQGEGPMPKAISRPSSSPRAEFSPCASVMCARFVRMSWTFEGMVNITYRLMTGQDSLTCMRKPCIAARIPLSSSFVLKDSAPLAAASAPRAPAMVPSDE